MIKLYLDNCCYNRPFDDLSVDKQLINASKKSNIKLKVMNPIEFLMEVVKWKLQQKN